MKRKRLLTMLLVLDIAQELKNDGQPDEGTFLMAELALDEIVRQLEKMSTLEIELILFGD